MGGYDPILALSTRTDPTPHTHLMKLINSVIDATLPAPSSFQGLRQAEPGARTGCFAARTASRRRRASSIREAGVARGEEQPPLRPPQAPIFDNMMFET